ncbi:hypothetical protein PNA2_1961 [Pyrococcus sp. NA2]|uniref:metallophosphoesterase family protein n=1 Tax=Pyrococcus sp. (strain NA2) TaxID=342949 RepID=UPI000209AE2F|nr:metallophosphoesterase [Pyrococcus sp. NA2]AEC52875.1 hypothetical protein PNA2_1961 [Pyrococcus sp. NA2]
MLFRKGLKIPKEVFDAPEKILHVSDTPTTFYPLLQDILDKIKPDVLIHTGDLADDIKLERRPWMRHEYEKALMRLREIITKFTVYIVPGNEDDPGIISSIFKNEIILIKPGFIVEIHGKKFALGHRPEDVKDKDADFKLYGHDPKSFFGLNGIHSINVIIYPGWNIVRIKYPDWVNYDRGYRILRGL